MEPGNPASLDATLWGSRAWAEHPFPAGRMGRVVFVRCVQQHEISHRGEIYLMLGLTGMEAPDV